MIRPVFVGTSVAGLLGAGLLCLPGIRESLRPEGARESWRNDYYVVQAGDVARRILGGESKIVLLDIREREEFDEFRIPDPLSVRIALRDLPTADLKGFREADLVIPYCLKDLRGFEGAKILRQRGLENVGIFEGFGIYAWENAGLPTCGTFNGKSDEAALSELRAIVTALPARVPLAP